MRIVNEAQELIAQETRSRKVIALVDNIISSSTTCLNESVGFLLLKDEAARPRRVAAEAKLRSQIKDLERMTRLDPKEHELVRSFRATARSLMIRENYILSVPAELSTSVVSSKNPIDAALLPAMFDRYTQLVRVQELEENKVKLLVEATSKLAGKFVVTLVVSFILSVGSLTVLALLIWRDLISRIGHVQGNVLHLLSQTPPDEPPMARDEIFELDSAIYKAAVDIDANEQIRRNYVSVVTHELRSPLASLQGTLELMGAGAFGTVPEPVKLTLSSALKTLRPVLELVNDFLGLESLKAGKLRINRENCELADVFEVCVKEIPASLHSQIAFEEEQGEASVFALDVAQVSRVVSNLVNLSLQHAAPETTVEVSGCGDDNHSRVTISISYRGTALGDVVTLTSAGLDGELPAESANVPAYIRLLLCSSILRLHGGALRFSSSQSNQHTFLLEISTAEEVPAGAPGIAYDRSRDWPEEDTKSSKQLRRKMRALVLAPLGFMLVLSAIIVVMLGEVKQDQNLEHRAWSICSDIAAVKNQSATSFIAAVCYNFTEDKWVLERWKRDTAKTRASLDHLSGLLTDRARNPDSDIEQFRQSVLKLSEMYSRILSLPKGTVVEKFWNAPVLKEMHAETLVNERLTANLLFVSGVHRELLSKKSNLTRSILSDILFASIVAGLILCLSLVLFVSKFMTNRLASLGKTTRALSSRSTLPARLEDNDEFSRIDAVLHEADRRLREFETFKKHVALVMMGQLSHPLNHLKKQMETIGASYGSALCEPAHIRIKRAVADCGRLQRLLEDLRSVQGMVGGKFELNRVVVSSDDIVESAVASLESAATRAGVTIVKPRGAALLDADPDRIVQVMINLLSNAIKFSPRGSTVEIEVESSGDGAIISVIDHGRGMSTEFQQRLFTAFAQMEIADASRKRGTGLGLYLCKTLVEQHGGSIAVESAENKGATFRVKLPLAPPSCA
ncbi:MAG: HAMP domain-containing histidine kinase [Candidatus Obscuribacterales bacterium]|nr:HAMP domain-containing histidine kinase [Candidatus Obscuribacterales bacterium]